MDALELVWDIKSNTAMSKSLGVNFSIERRGSNRGLPEGITFDSNDFQRTFAATTIAGPTAENQDQSMDVNHTLNNQVYDEFLGSTLISRTLEKQA
jgi:hypothetical protein